MLAELIFYRCQALAHFFFKTIKHLLFEIRPSSKLEAKPGTSSSPTGLLMRAVS